MDNRLDSPWHHWLLEVASQHNATHIHTHGERKGTEWSDGGEADVGLRVCAVKGWQHSSWARLDWVGKKEGQQQQENPIIGCPLSLGSVADDDLRGISVRNTLALASRQTFLWHFFVVARDPGLRRRNLSSEYYSSKTKQNNVHRSWHSWLINHGFVSFLSVPSKLLTCSLHIGMLWLLLGDASSDLNLSCPGFGFGLGVLSYSCQLFVWALQYRCDEHPPSKLHRRVQT